MRLLPKLFIPLTMVLALALALPQAPGAALADDQTGSGLRGLLSDLLGGEGTSAEEATSSVHRRVPLGRAEMQLSFAPLVRATAPAVVNVYASKTVQRQSSPFAGDPFFERFFGGPMQPRMRPRVQSSLGSGVIVDGSGIVVTNYHVIRNADAVKVALSDGREFESTILLKDETVDLAVLKIEAGEELPTIGLGNSDDLQVGDLVLAIGNPFGVGQTTTTGIVSALGRTGVGIADFGFFVQTDAAINPGNSGGALVDMRGQLVGVNTAIFSRSGGSNGIGFAVPSNMVRAVVEAGRSGASEFVRPYFGAEFEAVTAQVADALGMRRPTGALVANVTEDSPAEKAGVKPGDVLLSMNGQMIEHPDALGYRLATQPLDSEATFELLSGGDTRTVEVVMRKAPEGAIAPRLQITGESPFAGATVTALSAGLANRLRMRGNPKGVVITDIDNRSPAARFGLRPRDIVREVNGEVIETPQQLERLASQNSRWWRFAVERNGRILRQTLRY